MGEEGCETRSNDKAGADCPEIEALVMLPPEANTATWQVKLPIAWAVGFAETHPAGSWACLEIQVALGPSAGSWSMSAILTASILTTSILTPSNMLSPSGTSPSLG